MEWSWLLWPDQVRSIVGYWRKPTKGRSKKKKKFLGIIKPVFGPGGVYIGGEVYDDSDEAGMRRLSDDTTSEETPPTVADESAPM